MRLKANVRRATGATRHVVDGRNVTSNIAWVEIEPADGAFYLLYFSTAGECLTDTWHESIEQAKHQALFEFEIEEADWKEVT
jgi:hypothetical protein